MLQQADKRPGERRRPGSHLKRAVSLLLCMLMVLGFAATSFAAETYKISYYNDGDLVDEANIPAGSTIQVRTKIGLNKSGYSFAGWATQPDARVAEYVYPAQVTPTRDMALHAVWLDDGLNPADARYTVVRNYYIDGEKKASYVQNEVSAKAGDVISGADIAANNADWRKLVIGDQIWSFILSGSQPARLTLTEGANIITLRYDAASSVSTGPTGSALYTVVRDYFINGLRTAQVTEQQVAANAGDVLMGSQVAESHPTWKRMTLDGVTWSFVFAGSTPERFTLEEGSNTITLRYNATGTSQAAASETTSRIVRNYYIDGQLRDSVTENSMPATAGDIVDCTRIADQHPEWKTQTIDGTQWQFQFTGANPSQLEIIRGENVITLRYDTELVATSGRTVYYNANLGHGQAPAPQKVGVGGVVTAQSGDSLYRSGYLFSGWATSPNATQAVYYPGQAFAPSSNMTLYAVWTPNGALTGSAQYVIVRYYYIDGREIVGLTEPEVRASVGETLSASQIAAANPAWETYAWNGQAYSFEFTEGSPEKVVLQNGLNTITLRYDATGKTMPSATDRVGYSVIRNYYVDGNLLAGIAENEFVGREGDIITSASVAANNPAWDTLTKDGRIWSFTLAKASPERITLAKGQNTITLTYNATGSTPVYSSGDAEYTVIRNYYVNGSLVAGIEENAVAGNSGDSFSGMQIAAVNPGWKTLAIGNKAWSFECTQSDPVRLTLAKGPNRITLRYDATSASEYELSAAYTIIRNYFLNGVQVASFTENDKYGFMADVVTGAQIAADNPGWHTVSIGNHPRLYAYAGSAPEQISLGPGRKTITLRYEATSDSDSAYGTASYIAVRQYYSNGKLVQEIREKEVPAAVGDSITASQIVSANPSWTLTSLGQFVYTDGQPDYKVLNAGQNVFTLRYDLVNPDPAIARLTYDANGAAGAVPSDSTAQPGTMIEIKNAAALHKDGYRFLGWSTNKDAKAGDVFYAPGSQIVLARDMILYAIWAPENGFIVTFDGNGNTGGQAPVPQTANAGDPIRLPAMATLTKTGYHFCGWASVKNAPASVWKAGTLITPSANMTLYAVWERDVPGQPMTLTYDLNDGTGRAVDSKTVTAGTTVTVTAAVPERTGLIFLGWASSSDAVRAEFAAGSQITVGANIRLYAVWQPEADTFTLSYDLMGGNGEFPAQKGASVRVSGRVPMREGFTFIGWTPVKGSAAADAAWAGGTTHRLSSNTVLYAVWQIAPASSVYTLTYNANGGQGAPAAQKGKTIAVSSSTPVRDGYTFLGWSTDAHDQNSDASWTPGAERTLTADTQLHAVWKQYVLTYSGFEGSEQIAPQTGGIVTLKEALKNKEDGSKFSAWMNLSDSKMYKAGAKIMLASDMVLQPVWSEKVSKVDPDPSVSPAPSPSASADPSPSASASTTTKPSPSASASGTKTPAGGAQSTIKPSGSSGSGSSSRSTYIPEANKDAEGDKGGYVSKTGDTQNVWIWISVCCAAALVIGIVLVQRRSAKKENS